jgi:hypothetical protein
MKKPFSAGRMNRVNREFCRFPVLQGSNPFSADVAKMYFYLNFSVEKLEIKFGRVLTPS